MPDAETHQSRTAIRELLELIGNPEAQRAYERDVPIANVPAELISMWFDDHYHPGSAWFLEGFSGNERAVLAAFNEFYESRLDVVPITGGVDELQNSNEWREIVDQANATLVQLGWSLGK